MSARVVVECDSCGYSVTWPDPHGRFYKKTVRAALSECEANGWQVSPTVNCPDCVAELRVSRDCPICRAAAEAKKAAGHEETPC